MAKDGKFSVASSEVVVEMGRDDQTVNVFCWVNGETLRGKHSVRNLQREGLIPLQAAAGVSGYPGHQVVVDADRRSVKVVWPLRPDTKEFEDFKKRCAIAGEHGLELAFEASYEDLTEDEIDEWCFWLGRVVESGDAQVLRGDVPFRTPKRVLRQRRVDSILDDPLVAAGLMNLDNKGTAIGGGA